MWVRRTTPKGVHVAERFKKRNAFLVLYLVFAILPVYWMINMSFKTFLKTHVNTKKMRPLSSFNH